MGPEKRNQKLVLHGVFVWQAKFLGYQNPGKTLKK